MRRWARDRGLGILQRAGVDPHEVKRELPEKFQRR
jgi:hypothetical protein